MRVSIEFFSHVHILKLLFLLIFCWYFRFFVGTNDMLVGLHVPTNSQMYRQNSEKSIMGGGGAGKLPPCPLPWLRYSVVNASSTSSYKDKHLNIMV